MSNSLPGIVHNISQDNDDDNKHAAKSLKRCNHYLIHKVELSKAAKLRRDKKAKEKALLKACSLPNKVADTRAATVKSAAKKEKHKQYYLIYKETINYKVRLRRA